MTQTRAFGTPSRVSHDSSEFYARRMSEVVPELGDLGEPNEVPSWFRDRILIGDSRQLQLPDRSVHLVVTSPPYNVGKDYDVDLSLGEWLDLLAEVLAECWRVLVPGGRIAVNVAGVGRRPYLPLHHRVSELLVDLGFWLRGEIVWEKVGTGGTSCAWGSWRSASNPSLRDVHEYVIVASKGSAKLPRTEFAKQKGREDTISRDEFMEATRSIWRLRSAQASRVGHPAPFPVELPRRLIELLSFRGDTVLDPFVGSGSTAIAARDVERHFVGVDISPKYVQLARERLGAPVEEEE